MTVKGGLGRGLNKGGGIDAIIAPKKSGGEKNKNTGSAAKKAPTAEKQPQNTAKNKEAAEFFADISLVLPNQNQPRKEFDEAALQELAESIRQYGVISPLIVRSSDGFYEIIAGERRWRAAKLAGLKKIPVIVRDYDAQIAAEVALIENMQREDLNPIEEAKAYQRLMDEFSLKQEEIAEKVSKSRVFITNSLRLLRLDAKVQRMLEDKLISAGHARAILGLSDPEAQYAVAQRAFHENLSVREVEKLVRNYGKAPAVKSRTPDSVMAVYADLTEKLTEALGTKVSIHCKDNEKGRLEISYHSPQELEDIAARLIRGYNKQ